MTLQDHMKQTMKHQAEEIARLAYKLEICREALEEIAKNPFISSDANANYAKTILAKLNSMEEKQGKTGNEL